jgi:hypothetical protein
MKMFVEGVYSEPVYEYIFVIGVVGLKCFK